MRAIWAKATSERGASITFALLLFLVCAIISSVVVVAATAVGGRASQMAEMDRRYYAVNSAAELMRDVLEAQTVTVTTGTRTVSTVDQAGAALPDTTPEETELDPVVALNGTEITDPEAASLVTDAARLLAGIATDPLPPLELTATDSDTLDASALEALGVLMTPMLDAANRALYVDISNSDAAKGVYKLRLTFKADSTPVTNTRTSYGPKTPTRDAGGRILEGRYTREKTVTTTTETSVAWKMTELQTVVAALPTVEPEPELGEP